MSKAEFQLAYDGPALRSGTMDVNQLASALLATGDLFREANRQLNGDRAEVSIKVRSDFKKGSFEVALLVDQGLVEQAKNLVLQASTVGAAALVTFLFGTEAGKQGVAGVVNSVLEIWKRAKGEKPKTVIDDPSRRITIVVTGDNNQINTNPTVAKLYGDAIIRSSIAGAVRPVEKPGIESLAIRKGNKVIGEVQKSDLPPTSQDVSTTLSHGTAGAGVLENTREVLLRVTRANFDKGKWGFSDGSGSFSAQIDDDEFMGRLDAHEIGRASCRERV